MFSKPPRQKKPAFAGFFLSRPWSVLRTILGSDSETSMRYNGTNMEKEAIDGLSADIKQERIDRLKGIVPEIFSEGRIDPEKLSAFLGADAYAPDEEGERFRLEWAGKSKVYEEIARRTSCTLTLDESRSSEDYEKTNNIFIEGENLEALRVLQKAYFGKVKMIYIDPPYNTGKDFVYNDNFRQTEAEYCEDTCNVDENGNLKRAYRQNTKDSGRYHSNWLSMMYPRLYLARNLLKDDGVIFVSIDDNEVHNLRALMNEIFGEENFVELFSWQKTKTPPNLSRMTKKSLEYVLLYRKSSAVNHLLGMTKESPSSNSLLNQTNKVNVLTFPAGVVETGIPDGVIPAGTYGTSSYSVELLSNTMVQDGYFVDPIVLKARFRWTQRKLDDEISKGTIVSIRTKTLSPSYEKSEYAPEAPWNLIDESFGVDTNETAKIELEGGIGEQSVFDYPKPTSLIRYFLTFLRDTKDSGDIILDFFSGSGTTAHAVMAQNAEDGGNRKYICVQMPEETPEDSEARKAGFNKISDIAVERIKRAAQKIRSERPSYSGDLGVRVYRVTDSNFPQWHARSFDSDSELEKSLFAHVGKMASGDERNRATEVLLKSGYDLSTSIDEKNGFLLAEDSVALVLKDDSDTQDLLAVFESKPKMVIVLERIFKNDDSKINFALRCKEEKVIFQTV